MLSRMIPVVGQAIYIFLFTLGVGTILVYMIAFFQYNTHIFSIEFMKDYVLYYWDEISIGIAMAYVGQVTYNSYLVRQMRERKNCVVNTVTLEELSKIWLPADRRNEEIRAKVLEEVSGEFDVRMAIVATFEFELRESQHFFEHYIKPNLRYIAIKELSVIRDLIKILEKEGGCSSVASAFDKDPETLRFRQEPRDNITSYDIYGSYTLYDHSMRVARKMFAQIEIGDEEFNLGWQFKIGKAVVIALAHDIGKIEVIRQFSISQPKEIRRVKSHAVISGLMFVDLFYDYEDAHEMAELIENHHAARKDLDRLGVQLVAADKEARKEEMSIWGEHKRNKSTYQDAYSKRFVDAETVSAVDATAGDAESAVEQKHERERSANQFDLDEHLQKRADIVAPLPPVVEVSTDGECQARDALDEEMTAMMEEKAPQVTVEVAFKSAEEPSSRAQVSMEKQKKASETLFASMAKYSSSANVSSDGKIEGSLPEEKAQEETKKVSDAVVPSKRAYNSNWSGDAVEFDFGEIESDFKQKLHESLNTWLGNHAIPACITFNGRILLNTERFNEIIKEIMVPEEHEPLQGYMKHAVRVLYNQGVATEAAVLSGMYYTQYFIVTVDGRQRKFICVSINGEYLELGREQLDMNFKKSPIKKIRVIPRDAS